jgi:hypothetical protein
MCPQVDASTATVWFAAVLCAVPCADELRASQGQGLVAAMPAPFFQESFDVDQQQLWEELVQVIEWAFADTVSAAANDAGAVGWMPPTHLLRRFGCCSIH